MQQAAYASQVPPWFLTALSEYGQKEIAGKASNPRITEYLRSTSLATGAGDETPWCSAFTNWCMLNTGVRGTHSAAARSWLTYGRKLTVPTIGCIAVLWRDDPDSTKGHVGFYVTKRAGDVYLLSGNQGNQVSIAPYPEARVLDYRMP